MDMNNYIKLLGKQIHNKELRKDAIQEYSAHIEDYSQALIDSGFSKEDALDEAIKQMGDPISAGKSLNSIHVSSIDWSMLLWFFLLNCLVVIYYLIPSEYNWLSIYTVPNFIANIGGLVFATCGLTLCIIEKYNDLPLFYAYAENWNDGFFLNSGSLLVLSILFFARSLGEILLLGCIFAVYILSTRYYITRKRHEREANLLFETGIASSDLNYTGTVKVHGKTFHAITNKEQIVKGSPILVIGISGFKPLVTEL